MRLILRVNGIQTTHYVYRIIANAARAGHVFAYVTGSGVISFAWSDVMTIEDWPCLR